jgi:hypothetical protein
METIKMVEYDADDLQPICDGILEVMGTFGPNVFNFNNLIINHQNLEKAILMLRVTSTFSGVIEGWDTCLLKCRKLCKIYGVDENGILFGMIDPSESVEDGYNDEELP